MTMIRGKKLVVDVEVEVFDRCVSDHLISLVVSFHEIRHQE